MKQLYQAPKPNSCWVNPHLPKFTVTLIGGTVDSRPKGWTSTLKAWKALTTDQQKEWKALYSTVGGSFPSDNTADWGNFLTYLYVKEPTTANATASLFSGKWTTDANDTTSEDDKTDAVTAYNEYYDNTTSANSLTSTKANYIKVESSANYTTIIPKSIQTAYTTYKAGQSAGSLNRLWANLSSDNDLVTTAQTLDTNTTELDKAVAKFTSWTEQFTNYFRDKYLNDAGNPATSTDRGNVIPLNYAYVEDDNKLIVPNWTWLKYYGQSGDGWLAFFCFFNHKKTGSTWTATGLPTLPEETKGGYSLCKTVDSEWKTISDKIKTKYPSDPVLYKETAYADFSMWTPAWATSSDKIQGDSTATVDFSNIGFDIKKAVWYFCSDNNTTNQGNMGVFIICELLGMAAKGTGDVTYGNKVIKANNSAITGDNANTEKSTGEQVRQLNATRTRAQIIHDAYVNAGVKDKTY